MWNCPLLWLAIGVFLVGSYAAPPRLTSPLGPVVDLDYAAYAGNATSPTGQANSSVTFFGGIPYVQPPLGDLRFRAPKDLDEHVKTNRTVVDARGWGPTCVQQPAVEGVGVEGKKNGPRDERRRPDSFCVFRLFESEHLEAHEREGWS